MGLAPSVGVEDKNGSKIEHQDGTEGRCLFEVSNRAKKELMFFSKQRTSSLILMGRVHAALRSRDRLYSESCTLLDNTLASYVSGLQS